MTPPSPIPTAAGDASVAFQRTSARADARIEVSSPQIDPEAPIPERHTDYGRGRSPALRWDAVDGARSYVLLVEDPDAGARPFVHWLAWNIPPGVHALPEAIPRGGNQGMEQGINSRGNRGYFGPRPPRGAAPHHYHFQVFALDRDLCLPDDADRDHVLTAMDGHVLAKGEFVATGRAPH